MRFLDRIFGPDPERWAERGRAGAAVDRELAANLELSAMFDSAQQAAVFENGEFTRFTSTLRRELSRETFEEVASVYAAMPDVEAAMERRGPARSIRPEDRALIESWEGDVRTAQRALRAALSAPPASVWTLVVARLRGGTPTRR
jgi:hypothetical protein